MRCEEIENLLNEHVDVELKPAQRKEVDAHVATCDDCRTAWHAAAALRRQRELPTPAPSSALIAKLAAMRRPTGAKKRVSPWAAAVGGALAAGVALIAFDYYRTRDDGVGTVPSVTMSLNEARDVSMTIDSPEAFMDVDLRVLLTGGIELKGFGSRRELKWKTDLEAGVNRLTLPIVASDRPGGKLLVAVGHGDKQRAFVVEIHVNAEEAEI
jgi:hypothetical protein